MKNANKVESNWKCWTSNCPGARITFTLTLSFNSSEKFSDLSWKEYDWLRDLVEIIETGNSPEHYYEFTKLCCICMVFFGETNSNSTRNYCNN